MNDPTRPPDVPARGQASRQAAMRNQEYVITENSHYSSSEPLPANYKLVDTQVTNTVLPPTSSRQETRIVKETLPDGTVISRQIVVEEEETLVERRLYRYEPTSPIMARKGANDPAESIAVQTGSHRASDFVGDGSRKGQQTSTSKHERSSAVDSTVRSFSHENLPKNGQDPRYRDPNDPRYRDPNDPRYQDPNDPRYRDPNDPIYRDPNDPRYRDPNDPRYRDPNDPRYQISGYQESRYESYHSTGGNGRDPRDGDPRYEDPRYRDPNNPRYRDPNDPRYRDPNDPRYRDLNDPRFQDPRYQDPRYQDPRYQDPRYQSRVQSEQPNGSLGRDGGAGNNQRVLSYQPESNSNNQFPNRERGNGDQGKEPRVWDPRGRFPGSGVSSSNERISDSQGARSKDPNGRGFVQQSYYYEDRVSNNGGVDSQGRSPQLDAPPRGGRGLIYNDSFRQAAHGEDDDGIDVPFPPAPELVSDPYNDPYANEDQYDTVEGQVYSSGRDLRGQNVPQSDYYDNEASHSPLPPGRNAASYSETVITHSSHPVPQVMKISSSGRETSYSGSSTPGRDHEYSVPAPTQQTITYTEQHFRNLNLDGSNQGQLPPKLKLSGSKEAVDSQPRPVKTTTVNLMAGKSCARCGGGFGADEEVVTTGSNELWHRECFVCAHCFQPFSGDTFYDFEGRKYCPDCFNVLFARCCAACSSFVEGRVIKALNKSWHPSCFQCTLCATVLSDLDDGFLKFKDNPYCKPCYWKVCGEVGKTCKQCSSLIDVLPNGAIDGVRFKDAWYHAYHFECTNCKVELTRNAREVQGKLYCLKCSNDHICALCRQPIENERSIIAMNKVWHIEHFRCAYCDKAFHSSKHYVFNAQPYCEEHYNKLFGNLCFYCNHIVPSPGVSVEGKLKKYCEHHFECFFCSKPLNGVNPHELNILDGRPICVKCTKRFPSDFQAKNFKDKNFGLGGGVSGNVGLSGRILNPFKKTSDK